uniref:Gypsy retrotransposon integrase-like protein 1 n=1 Tax=Salmo trutta TaxID=8032 RepID=A0A674CT74_SALTR
MKDMLPTGLVGPSSVVPVQIEGIYAKALLDSGSQITLLYRSFYDKYLTHLPLIPIGNLEIWGLSSDQYPYDGYLSLKLEFSGSVVGVAETMEALVLVCPDPAMKGDVSILVGTNTSVVRRLMTACKEKEGEGFLSTLQVHPAIKEAYERLIESSTDDEEKRGTVWFAQTKPVTLPPGGQMRVTGIPKFPGIPSTQAILVERPEEPRFPDELLVRPEIQTVAVVSSRRITLTVRNVSTKEITLKRGTPIAHLFPVDVAPGVPLKSKQDSSERLTSSSFNFGDSSVPEGWKKRLCEKMMERKEVFSTHEFDVGCSKSTHHTIRVTEDKPFRERSRRLAPADVEDVRKHLNNLKSSGIISESRSPYASPIVVVRKKNGTIRMCVDYRTLNKRTVPDQYTVPRVEDALTCLSGSKWFSVLDLRSGYYQIPMGDTDKEKTAFICPVGFYQFERMPQGVSGAPATFQRVMEKTVGDMNLLEVLVYLDDLIVFGRTLEEHEQRLLKVLDRLKSEGLKLSLDKCQFCRTSVNYVGHIISQNGVATDPSKIEAVTTWPKPETVTALRSFLGFCGYYRRFVKDYSKVSYPLNQLLCGYLPSAKKGRKSKEEKAYLNPSEPFGSRWDAKCELAFETLKESLTKAPVLGFADPQLPYVLHVDASREGLGGVLYQDQGEGPRPVAFVSRSLTASERNYPAHKLEFLALKWAVVDKLHDYLYGAKFEVRTDNNPLTYVLTSAKLDATGHRWLAALSTYDFSLKYRPSRQNIDADALSRRSHQQSAVEQDWRDIPASGVRAMCQMSNVVRVTPGLSSRVIDQLGASMHALPQAYCNLSMLKSQMPRLSTVELSASQQEDPCLGEMWVALNKHDVTRVTKTKHPLISLLLREWEKLKMEDGVMYRITHPPNETRRAQLLLPEKFRTIVLKSLHDDSGHLGFDKTYGLVRDRFYWPRMKMEVEDYCKSCARCVQRKTLPKIVAPLGHMQSEGPMDLVCMDFLSIEPDSSNIENVLVITDHYTRYAQAFPTKDQKASTVAKVLWERFFIHYGLPKRMHSDQGRDFESRLIRELLNMLGVEKSRTTPYHPQGDPQPERFNRTLLNMLGTLDPTQKKKWSQYIGHLVHSYNCTRNEATGYSPYFLMFGREARLPVDICFGVSSDSSSERTYLKYVSDMKKQLQAAYKVAESTAGKQNHENKQRYDKKIRYTQLMPGDRVLIRNLGLHGKHKLADRWVSTPYVVESQMSNVPVFRLKPESGDGPNKILHRNHLLPLGQKVRLEPVVNIELTPSRRTLQRRRTRKGNEKLPGKCTPQNNEKVEEVKNPEDEKGFDSEDEDIGVWYDVPNTRVEEVKNPKDEKDFDSEDEDIGVWYDVPNTNCMSREVEEMSEPFSLDLDIVWNQIT